MHLSPETTCATGATPHVREFASTRSPIRIFKCNYPFERLVRFDFTRRVAVLMEQNLTKGFRERSWTSYIAPMFLPRESDIFLSWRCFVKGLLTNPPQLGF